jgi:hypothetical protein
MARVAAPEAAERKTPARLPEGIREAVGANLARLSKDCNEALRVAAVIGHDPSATKVGRVLREWPGERVLEALEEATRGGVLEDTERGPGAYRFVHAVYRETLVEGMTLATRVKLRARVAQALEELYGAASAGMREDGEQAELEWGAGVAWAMLARGMEAAVHMDAALCFWERSGHGRRAAEAFLRFAERVRDRLYVETAHVQLGTNGTCRSPCPSRSRPWPCLCFRRSTQPRHAALSPRRPI